MSQPSKFVVESKFFAYSPLAAHCVLMPTPLCGPLLISAPAELVMAFQLGQIHKPIQAGKLKEMITSLCPKRFWDTKQISLGSQTFLD